ncbi:FtsK/SpoIIIE domain-containing protein [Streptomyces sp. A3M-1-3]|uniref:FtsK/SpoIIIE domain-containing protein n=1 Tax=Streptomyces sp. A3M-1-3 TaxID=2962044 RepID=UPI0020B87681|nr:FtsK/SpoIIIE domain-containing protein [Streptomyces sp. A3M-1-3]MCP3822183.1 FtsK/SpoIIIE domain-containing protein [Streptomyces sp. A3M-1-3]
MQIRLTVLGPRSGQTAPPRACDVLVTAPAGTALAAVASGLAATVMGPDVTGAVVLYAGQERLDAQRRTLGEPPLVDGAVLSLQAPAEDDAPADGVSAQLHVVAGPDAGGVHLLHGGQIRIGRSADADVPLDDPDVSRLHCVVTVAEDGRVSVADLGSTNGTSVDGSEVHDRPVRLTPGALLRVGESGLRLAPPGAVRVTTTPDAEGHLRLPPPTGAAAPYGGAGTGAGPAERGTEPGAYRVPAQAPHGAAGRPAADGARGATGHYSPSTASAASRPGAGRAARPGPPGGMPTGGSAIAGGADSVRFAAHSGGADAGGGRGMGEPGDNTTSGRDSASGGRTAAGTSGEEQGTAVYGVAAGGQDCVRYAATRGSASGGSTAPGATRGTSGPVDSPAGDSGSAAREARGSAGDGTATRGGTDLGAGSGRAVPAGSPAGDSGSAAREARGSAGGGAATLGGAAAGGRRGGVDGAGWGRRGIGAWARRLAGGRESGPAVEAALTGPQPAAEAPAPEAWPDAASLLLTALGPGPRLWERGPGHPEALVLRLGTADRPAPDGAGLLPAVPVTVGLREAGSLGLAGPRARLSGLARSVVAQLAALHAPHDLEIVLISADRARSLTQRTAEWSWLGWLPHLRPAHGQDCRLLLAYDREQAAARTAELVRRLDDGPLGPGWASAEPAAVAAAAWRHTGPYTVVIVDGDPGSAVLRETTARLAAAGAAAGIHLLCLAETPAASPVSPVAATYEAACSASLAFRECGAVALLSGDVATALRLLRTAHRQPAGHGAVAVVDAVSAAWAERFARAVAPLRADGAEPGRPARSATALPAAARLLDELGLARATPASLMARWAAATDEGQGVGGHAEVVLGTGQRGPVGAELVAEGPHLLIEGPVGSGRTELLRSVAASLCAAARPDRLGLVLVDGAGGERGEGLRACTELPHVSAHLVATDPVRMRDFAQALGAELKRRAELLGTLGFAEWHAQREVAGRMVAQRPPSAAEQRGELDSPPSGTLRLRAAAAARTAVAGPTPLPRLVVLVDDLDALVAPALGSTGRPAAGSVVRVLEAVAREGERLGVHLVAATARPDRTADTELARGAALRVVLAATEDAAAGRGQLHHPDGRVTPFQGGRVTGRIPRTATLRPTVVPVEWERMGDPPTRRPVRELGNGPTDLALLASALDRAARLVDATPVAFAPGNTG